MSRHTTGYFFEDLRPGLEIVTLGRTILEADVSQFVQLTGLFEETFINHEYVTAGSVFGRPVAPGALVFAFAEGLAALAGLFHQGLAFLGIGELSIRRPTAVGDTITVAIEVSSARESTKPDRGVVGLQHIVVNQRGETVMDYNSNRLIRRVGQDRPAD